MNQNKNQLGCKKKICSNCKSKNIIKWCNRKTMNRGLIQRYKCKNCQVTFTIDNGFFRMRNPSQRIINALLDQINLANKSI